MENNVALERWRDAKLGLFIHWGLYSIPAGVWQGDKGYFGETNAVDYAEHIQLRHKIPNAEYAKLAIFGTVDDLRERTRMAVS